MKKTFLAMALIAAMAQSASAAVTYNEIITAIFGSGNPNTGWTADTSSGIQLALRGKDRITASTANASGVYSFPTGAVVTPSGPRARWNWEFSINSGAANLDVNYDYYVAVDTDPSACIDYTIVNALTFWTDNSYGNNSTPNGQGVEGTSGPPNNYASENNIAQQSQNLVFAGGNPLLDAYNYGLFAVAKGAGPTGTKVASVEIKVVVGLGGAVCGPDFDGDSVPDSIDNCPDTPNTFQEDADDDGIGDVCDNPTSKDDCKKGGWTGLFRANGTPFKNQGDCIQYVNTGK